MKVVIEGRLKYPKAAETAPFATDRVAQSSPAEMRLKVSMPTVI